METEAARAVVCISDDELWLDNIASAATAADASIPERLGWEQFDSAPMQFAHAQGCAYAHVDEQSASLDVRLGQLCRSFPFGVWLELAANVNSSDQQLFAHGFQKLDVSGEKMARLTDKHRFLNSKERCFHFRLQDYKAVPDWLNARFWAHPDRFHL